MHIVRAKGNWGFSCIWEKTCGDTYIQKDTINKVYFVRNETCTWSHEQVVSVESIQNGEVVFQVSKYRRRQIHGGSEGGELQVEVFTGNTSGPG